MRRAAGIDTEFEGRASQFPHAREPRICMPTFSSFARNVYRTGIYEAQDVLVDCDDVDRVHLELSREYPRRWKWLSRLVNHGMSGLVFRNPGLRPVRLTRDYDLFMHVCAEFPDVWYANAIQGWQERCRTSVCWIVELWAGHLPKLKHWLPILSKFDHVIVGMAGSGKALGDAIGRPCHEILAGVDTIRFSPYPKPPARVIDVYSIGRRWEGVHETLLKLAAAKQLFYVHDTLENVGYSSTVDCTQHRDQYASLAKRSRFFLVAQGKANSPEETYGQITPGFRYYEGLAAGAVLLGQDLDCEVSRQQFGWPHAVININPDGSDTAQVMSRLSAEPEQLREMSSRNAEEALRRHDWVYRWKEILGLAGLKPSPTMVAREKRLGELAELPRESGQGQVTDAGTVCKQGGMLRQ